MATSPNYNWPEPDNTDLVKNGALAIRTAVNAIDTSLAELKGGTTGQVLSKTSATDMDFTWVTTDDANAIQNAIVDAKGDLIAATANDTPARLAVGANNTFLRANSSAATGLEYAGSYTTFTPSWLNLTVGNGTNTGRYLRIGNFVHVEQKFTLGSTSSVSGPVYCGFPIAANTTNNNLYYGDCIATDTGVLDYLGTISQADANNFIVKTWVVVGARINPSDLTSTSPFVWGTGDVLTINYSYEVA
jgi:hypothetical protein